MGYMNVKSQPINNANSDQNHTNIYHWYTTQNKLSSPICFSSSGGNEYNESYFLLGYIILFLGN